MKEEIKNKVSDVLELPKDIILNLPKITLLGNITIFFENHKGIVEYESNIIKINTNVGIIAIMGENLIIKSIIADEIIIEGSISSLKFED